jgi:hypothetical protein
MAKRKIQGTHIDCRYQGKAMTQGQIEYVVWCMLTAALDMIEDGAPAGSITLKERTRWLASRPVTDLSSYERGALEGAGMALSIFYAQYVGDGMGAGDALAAAGDFGDACEKFMFECWKDGGEAVRKAIASKGTGGYQIKDVLPAYPDVDKCAKAFADAMTHDYEHPDDHPER